MISLYDQVGFEFEMFKFKLETKTKIKNGQVN